MSKRVKNKTKNNDDIEVECIIDKAEEKKETFSKKNGRSFFRITGVKMRFKTYNSRRRVRKFFGAAAGLVKKEIVKPAALAWAELKEICSEVTCLPADIRAGRSEGESTAHAVMRSFKQGCELHNGFWRGVRNVALPVICLILMVSVAVNLSSRSYALRVTCNDQVLGYVEDEKIYNEALQKLSQRLSGNSDDYRSTLSPSYSVATADKKLQMDSDSLCEAILADSDNVDNAYGLYIDGELCAAVKSYGDAQYIMESFLKSYSTNAENEIVSFMGKTELVAGLYSTDKIVSSEAFAKTISTRRTETQIYTVQEGDTPQSIAGVADMSVERLKVLNDDMEEELDEGTSLIIEKTLPVLAVQTVRTETVTETIPYEKKKISNANEYVGYSKCTTKGVNGQRIVERQITEVNGVEVSKEILSSVVTKEPVTAVYVVGTKKASSIGSGSFTWPVPGVRTISSPYGYRWGRLHAGIDISTTGVYGRTVVAADSGTVTVKNSPKGYGLHIIISHNNGFSTCYAHLSAVNVVSGQTVAKGQAIGKVGNSGSSTGPHLHFEIRVNGSSRNPMNYF